MDPWLILLQVLAVGSVGSVVYNVVSTLRRRTPQQQLSSQRQLPLPQVFGLRWERNERLACYTVVEETSGAHLLSISDADLAQHYMRADFGACVMDILRRRVPSLHVTQQATMHADLEPQYISFRGGRTLLRGPTLECPRVFLDTVDEQYHDLGEVREFHGQLWICIEGSVANDVCRYRWQAVSYDDLARPSRVHHPLRAQACDRAMALLEQNLSPQQLKEFNTCDRGRGPYFASPYFTVVGEMTHRRYYITFGAVNNVFDDEGNCYCFQPDGIDTAGDVMLAQKIALENYEEEALRRANVTPGGRVGHFYRRRR